eukprot:1991893-Karenia_brevis.AAC.1
MGQAHASRRWTPPVGVDKRPLDTISSGTMCSACTLCQINAFGLLVCPAPPKPVITTDLNNFRRTKIAMKPWM